MATTLSPRDYIPKSVAPLRVDAPGTVQEMPSPNKIHHIHIFADQHYDEVVAFYVTLLNAEMVRERPNNVTFLTYDDYDHRIAIFKREGWSERADKTLGVSHVALAYDSLGELMFIYKKMKALGYQPHRALNHGNSTSFDYRDPDGNEVEIMMDNYAPFDNKAYKRDYQGTKEFGKSGDGDFDPAKMLALYVSGVPDSVLLDREEVKRLAAEGKL
jgi:catechol-2,3-dioxygenase